MLILLICIIQIGRFTQECIYPAISMQDMISPNYLENHRYLDIQIDVHNCRRKQYGICIYKLLIVFSIKTVFLKIETQKIQLPLFNILSLLKNGKGASEFVELVTDLVNFCTNNNVKLLRTVGIIFSDDEMRVGDYVN